MKDFSAHTVGGVNKDKDPRALAPNELLDANDNELFGNESGRDLSSYPYPSSLNVFDVPAVATQLQFVRCKFDTSATSYLFIIKDSSGNAIGPSSFSIVVNPVWTISDFVDEINTVLNAYGYGASYDSVDGVWFTLAIGGGTLGATPIYYSLTYYEVASGDTQYIPIYVLQEAFNPIGSLNATMLPLQGVMVNNVFFLFSRSYDQTCKEIGYGIPDQNGDWTYTTLLQTTDLDFPSNEVIEIQSEEVSNNQYALYWITNTGKPRTIYIPVSLASPLKYTMDEYVTAGEGIYSLGSIDEQTWTQIQNPATIEFEDQNQSGGALESGTWFYYVRVGIARNYSEWSPASNPIPVFFETTNSPSAGAMIAGDLTPQVTSKANVLNIRGVNSIIYDTIQVAALVNQGGNFSAEIIGEYDVDDDPFNFNITHTGLESGSFVYDPKSLPPVQDVIINAKNVQIKKNRLNYANIEKQVEEDLDAVFANVVLGQERGEINSIGVINYTQDPLFRAGLNSPYSSSSVGEQTILLDNDSTNGNFDNGNVFDLASRVFTVGVSGEYVININNLSFAGEILDIGAKEAYVVNLTTGEKYCYTSSFGTSFGSLTPSENFITNRVALSSTATLTAGDTLVLKAVFERINGTSTNYTVVSASFSVTKAISDYPTKSILVGEFQKPVNVATMTGYMLNETYPIFARLKYDSGYLSQWRHLGNYQFSNGTFPAILDDGFLTDSSGTDDPIVYTYGITVDGIDVSTIKDRVLRIEFGRGICEPTVLGTGIFIASDGRTGGSGGSFTAGLYTGNTDTANTYGTKNALSSVNRYWGVMICPDWATGTIKPQYQDGDYLICYSIPQRSYAPQVIAGGSSKWGSYREFSGAFIPFSGSPDTYNVVDAAYVDYRTNSRILRNDAISTFLSLRSSANGTVPTLACQGMAMTLDARIKPTAVGLSGNDYGCYYVQYYRPNPNQYNNVQDIKVVPCNHYVHISDSTPDALPMETVFGGDTYNQKTYMKVMYNAINPDTTKSGTLTSFLGFYSQNKINQQMRYVDKTFTNLPFPLGNTLDNYLFGVYDAGEQFQIDAGYSWENVLSYETPYNPRIPQQSIFKSRIIYSQQKVLNSLQDTYRVILPNDYKDLASKDGEINGLYDINDVMIGLQPFKVSVLPYQSDVGLSAADGSLYVGSGGVYAQRENPVSTYGASIKSGTLVAENESGNSVVYWYSSNAKGLMRYGSDGVKSLSNENGFRTWFFNHTPFVKNEFDIVMGYDRNRTAIFITTLAKNSAIAQWSIATAYSVDDVVWYGELNKYTTFEWIPNMYVCTEANTGFNPYNNPSKWEFIPVTDTRYYNYATVVFNEKGNLFQGFFSLLVSRYFFYDGRILLPRGRAAYNKVYDLFGGDSYLSWLSDGSTAKSGEFVLEWVSNKNGAVPKRFIAAGAIVGTNHNTANNPTLTVSTETQISTSVGGAEFEYLNGQISEGIYPDESDDVIISEYAKVRLSSTAYYRIFSLVVQFYQKARTIFR